MTDIVITGLGAITPLGDDVPSTWRAMLAGASGVRPIEAAWAADLPVRFAAQVVLDAPARLGRVAARRMDKVTQVAMVALHEAWADAGLAAGDVADPDRTGVVLGTGIAGLETTLAAWDTLREQGTRRVSPLTVPMLMANAPAAQVGLAIGARACVRTAVAACASSNDALAMALDELRLGRADVVVAGGAEACILPFTMASFAQMQALSTRNDEPERASRPFDTERDGFVLGEGAALLVLETLAHATSRGARIYGTLAGAGLSADSHDIVQPDPSGDGQRLALQRAMADAGVSPRDIVHVNAHATSTPAGDMAEARAITAALGGESDHVIVTAPKSQTGHLLGAAGALEALATVLALRDRVVPPTINLDHPEPTLGLDVATTARPLPPAGPLAAVSNSFGFGGHNVTLVFTDQHRTDGR
ncbi:MAG: beta-ketoacyl-[acyl-carrier-protein] synthase family protein [Actinomycetia bacterium]|nr:beta-ketoacyl-[acyl-carrier-protein] synthase family protein [Actinomycetes bacterium]